MHAHQITQETRSDDCSLFPELSVLRQLELRHYGGVASIGRLSFYCSRIGPPLQRESHEKKAETGDVSAAPSTSDAVPLRAGDYSFSSGSRREEKS